MSDKSALRKRKEGSLPGVGNDEGEPVVGADDDAVHQGAGTHIAGDGVPLNVPPAIAAGGLVQVTEFALRAPEQHQMLQKHEAKQTTACWCTNPPCREYELLTLA